MNIFRINSREFKKLKKYELDRSVTNVESKLFIIDRKVKWEHEKQLIKQFFVTQGEYFSNKLYTINTLIDNREQLDIDELVLPSELFVLDNTVQGYVMPFIEKNINLSVLLNSIDIPLNQKIEMLKQIFELLNKVLNIRGLEKQFFLGDVQESNFIYDTEKKMFRAVDLDSCKIGNNNTSISRYLTFNLNLWDYPDKYPMDSDDMHISNKNTTILSYIYILLNTISGVNISRLSISEYYNYLQYLGEQGFDNELINYLGLIYSHGDNMLDVELLDSIPTQKSFKLKYNEYKKLGIH